MVEAGEEVLDYLVFEEGCVDQVGAWFVRALIVMEVPGFRGS